MTEVNFDTKEMIEVDKGTDVSVDCIDMLLGLSTSDLIAKSTEYEIKSLSKRFGVPFIVELRRVKFEVEDEISKLDGHIVFEKNRQTGEQESVWKSDHIKRNILTIAHSTYYNGKQLFKSDELMSHFKVGTPAELIRVLITPSEITDMANTYFDMVNDELSIDEKKSL